MRITNKKNKNKKEIKIFLIKLRKVFIKSIFTFNLHSGSINAGFIAFSIIFAIFPFMIFFMTIIAFIGQGEIGIKLIDILKISLPNDISNTLLPIIYNVIHSSKSGILSIATFTLIWSASSLVQGLKKVLDKAYRIKIKKSYLFNRFMSILKFLFIIVLIIISIFSTIILPKILNLINLIIPINYNNDNLIVLLKPLLLIIFLFLSIVSIYYIIPSQQQKFKSIFWGSLFTLILWIITLKILIFYFEKVASFKLVYGSLAGIIITLYFFQIMSMILIFGAELNYNITEIFYKKKIISNNPII